MLTLCDIISNEKMTDDYDIYSMTINAPLIAKIAKPGQFVHVKCDGFTLRRPISIASAKDGQIRICYDVRGEGTEWMSKLKSGGKIDIIAPIGNGFDCSDTSKKVLLIGGGIGIYPLYSVAEKYGENAIVVLGFRTKNLITFEKEFTDCGSKLYIATDDGSYGRKGYAIETVKEILDNNKIDIVMTCGPKVMMKGIALESQKRNIRCQVSMEERMACGIGACLACVCKVKEPVGTTALGRPQTPAGVAGTPFQKGAFVGDGVLDVPFTNKRVCIDGPVFDIFNGSEVDWEW